MPSSAVCAKAPMEPQVGRGWANENVERREETQKSREFSGGRKHLSGFRPRARRRQVRSWGDAPNKGSLWTAVEAKARRRGSGRGEVKRPRSSATEGLLQSHP